MAADKGKTNFMRDFADESEQQQAYQEILEYLVNAGKYTDITEADNEASVRVRFCEEIDLYADDEHLNNASIHEKKIQVLIQANHLQDIIIENGGLLPDINHAGTTHEKDAAPEASDQESLDSAKKVVTESRSAAEGGLPEKQHPVLQAILYLGNSAIIVGVLLVSLNFLLNSEQQLQIIQYVFLTFTVLITLFIGLSEASSKILMRLRYAVSHSLFIATTSLSGLLFIQQQWDETAFTSHSGHFSLIVNSLTHSALIIGPYGLGMFFAVMSFLIFIAIQTIDMPQREK